MAAMFRVEYIISQGLNYLVDDDGKARPADSYFMAYHTTLKVSKDYYEALRIARRVSDDISNMLKKYLKSSAVEVFPYR
jgi:Niemann-Pick C1 protein